MSNNIQFCKKLLEYRIIESVCTTDGACGEKVFGVEIVHNLCPVETEIIHDVSACREEVAELIERLERGQVTPAFLRDIVEDFLEEMLGC